MPGVFVVVIVLYCTAMSLTIKKIRESLHTPRYSLIIGIYANTLSTHMISRGQGTSAVRAISVLKYSLKEAYLGANNFPNSFTGKTRLPVNIQSFKGTFCFTEGIHLPQWKTPLKNRQNSCQSKEQRIH